MKIQRYDIYVRDTKGILRPFYQAFDCEFSDNVCKLIEHYMNCHPEVKELGLDLFVASTVNIK